MGLDEIIDIVERTSVAADGTTENVFDVVFTTDVTSGTHSVTISEAEFTPDAAQQRAEERAQDIQAVVGGSGETE